jgi:hypothetical protein
MSVGPNPMAVYTLTSDEVARANLWLLRKKLGLRLFAFPVLGTGLLIGSRFAESPIIPATLGSLFILTTLLSPLWVKRTSKKLFSQTAALKEEITTEILEDKIEFLQASGTRTLQWGQVVKWNESGEHYYLYENDAHARLIPKRSISEREAGILRAKLTVTRRG